MSYNFQSRMQILALRGVYVCETVCLKIAKGATDPRLENCQKNFLNNYNKLLTSKLRALIKKFCRQAVKMLLSSCQL